ncbi:MAG: CPBP family intramembrane metalloprotease [Sporocytophaga sp.]|uniref:CPBP family intramembrane glutamic endopeptidase n=1 Tax=Sporocytophaga sp. TaxID=2231183 RepID=UPI001B12965F|nr:CPBP family intramembrane glutamic endopeptidase [Sporocytophaga sp.]MBO9700031.1 CPBP family intramembrane metalloprotease [Sporocytophaga sp.]
MENINSSGSGILEKTLGVLIVFLVLIGSMLIGSGLGHILLKEVWGISFNSETELLNLIKSSPDPKSLILKSQAVNAIITFLVMPLIYMAIFRQSYFKKFNPITKRLPFFLILSIIIFFMGMPLLAYLVDWNKEMKLPSSLKPLQDWMENSENLAKVLTETIIYYKDNTSFVVTLLVVALIPGIGEELVFRGVVQNELKDILKSPTLAIWITGFLFSFIHFQFFGFFPRMFLGVLFGYLYYWSGNIYVSMFVHFMNNALTLILANMYKQKDISFNPDSSESIPFYSVVVSLIAFSFFIYLYQRNSKEAGITK